MLQVARMDLPHIIQDIGVELRLQLNGFAVNRFQNRAVQRIAGHSSVLLPAVGYRCLPQRAAAAFWAISRRFFGVKLRALAAPPFLPPIRPSATAAGFLPSSAWN